MENVTAVISLLHESAALNSATRNFRRQPVLGWTLERLHMSKHLRSMAIICWEDQLREIAPIAAEYEAHVLAKGPRTHIASIESVAAARRWADGWRGGLLYTCDFDLGFHGGWVGEVIDKLGSDAAILVDPSAGLVDPKIIDHIIEHANSHPGVELCFTQAAPGLAGALVRPALAQRLASARTHPGRLLYYLPDQPMRDPIGGDGCVVIPTAVARTTRNFRLDSDRQVQRLTDAAIELNGELVSSDSEDLLNRLHWTAEIDPLPREVVVEINTERATCPIFWPRKFQAIQRPPMSMETARTIFEQISVAPDTRLTFSGVGDPLLHDQVFELIELAHASGISAIHIETDLLPSNPDFVRRLAESNVDIVSVHLPAMSPKTYATVMGVDQYSQVLENIKQFILRRQELARGVPILVPVFTKCQENLAEMEPWYDQWLKALGAAIINGPSDFAGIIPNAGVADMSPPKRRACGRLWSRMTILSNGAVASCEQDVTGKQIVGDGSSQAIQDIWQKQLGSLRNAHKKGEWSACALCGNCRDWHRP